LTKIMTAYLVLKTHPLSVNASGPVVQISPQDVAELATDEGAGETSLPVTVGERLDERQLLDGLLVHSANNLADVLARWVSGGVPAFVAQMNTTAAELGLTDTHFADASGYDPSSTSTATDLLRLTTAAMRIPTFAAVVAQSTVTLPQAGLLANYVPLVGTQGVVGVKSGYTQQAGGCVVLATERDIAGHDEIVLAAVTGQSGVDVLDIAARLALTVTDDVAAAVVSVPVLSAGEKLGTVTTPWRVPGVAVPVRSASGIRLLGWPGERITLVFSLHAIHSGEPAGEAIGMVTARIVPDPSNPLVATDGVDTASSVLRTGGALPGPSVLWHLLHP
jgi:D-alanyl-D-alanine carboxypeptidase (penicillin-binding protein 5/6)